MITETMRKYGVYAMMLGAMVVTSCDKDDEDVPEEENEEEVITDVNLVFTNANDPSDVVTATAQDPDGAGVEDLVVLTDIDLDTGKTYIMTIELWNNLETPGESISAEVEEEGDEHQFFFSFTNDAFLSPMGNGNIDNSSDAVNYIDFDVNSNPVGLETEWTTNTSAMTSGSFRVMLQHQPDIKSSTSGATDGDTDVDLTFVLNIQ